MNRLAQINGVFPAGPPLPESQQIGRDDAISGVEQRLRAREVLLLMEGRRTGKTSVAVAALDRIRNDHGRVAVATLTRFADARDAAGFLARQLQSSPGKAARSVVTLLRALDRKSDAELAGADVAAGLAVGGELADSALGGGVDLPGLVASPRRETTAILLDEAHAMLEWPAPVLASLNAVLRGELHAGVVLAGSDTEALAQLTTRGGPLHLVGSRIALPPIGAASWLGALRDGFARLEIEISEIRLRMLIELTGGHPYLTMRLARDLARIASDTVAPWRAGGAELELALFELRRDPIWTALNDPADD